MSQEGTGTINLPEYLILLEQCSQQKQGDYLTVNPVVPVDDIRGAFRMLDETGEGYVSVEKLRDKLTKYGMQGADAFLTESGVHMDGCLSRMASGSCHPTNQLPGVSASLRSPPRGTDHWGPNSIVFHPHPHRGTTVVVE